MKRYFPLALLISLSFFSFSIVPSAFAVITSEQALKMTQGEFALRVLKEAGALKRLPSVAASGQDAIDFLQGTLGIVPAGDGWEADKVVDEDFLKRLLEGMGVEGKGSIDELIQQIVDGVSNAIDTLPSEQNVNTGAQGPS